MRVALDAGLLDPVADPEELREALDRLGPHHRRSRGHEQDDCGERHGAARPKRAHRPRAEEHGGDREPEPDHGRHRAGEDDAERARRERGERPAPADRASVSQRDADRADDERRARERGEVVDPDERRLALARPLALELRDDAEELEQAPPGRGDAPRHERPEEGYRFPRRPHDEDRCGQERGVPRELRDADRVRCEGVLLAEERGRRERDGSAPARTPP